MSRILQLTTAPLFPHETPGGDRNGGSAGAGAGAGLGAGASGNGDRDPASDLHWAGPAPGRPDARGEPPVLPTDLPAPGPCPTCGGGNWWLDVTPDAAIRCEVCEPIPAPVLVARRLFVWCDWPKGVGGGRPPGYRWIDWGWVVAGQKTDRRFQT